MGIRRVGFGGLAMSGPPRQAVFLDRDGVINRALIREGRPFPPRRVAELEILPGVARALEEFRRFGFLTIVVTNQPDVARGLLLQDELNAIHDVLRAELAIEEIRVCVHDDADVCDCRKPRPGMLLDAARCWGIDLSHSLMVGDRWRDISAGRAAGCRTCLIGAGHAESFPDAPDEYAESLLDLSRRIQGKPAWPEHAEGDMSCSRLKT